MNPADTEEAQRARRKRRAREGNFPVVRLSEGGVEARFGVRSESGQVYEVEILAARERVALCTCFDYLTNTLGTCKHVEAVWLHLERKEPQALADAAARRPAEARVYLDHGEELRVRLLRPETSSPELDALLQLYFDDEGTFVGELWRDFGGLTRSTAALGGVRIDPEVHAHVRERRRRTRREALLTQARNRVLEGEDLGVTRPGLRPYQRLGALHLAYRERAVLADEIGLGKSAQALAAAELLRRDEGLQRTVVVCPASASAHWVAEIDRFCGEAAARVQGTPESRQQHYARQAAYTVVPDEVLVADQEELTKLRPDLLILDAAQRIRDWRSKSSEAVKRLATRFTFVLVDTALTDDPDRLYAVIQLVDQRLLGPLWRFNPRYFVLDDRGGVHGARNREELAARVEPLLLRRRQDQVAGELPARIETVHRVPLPFGIWARVKDLHAKLREHRRKSRHFMRRLGELRQAWDALDEEHPPKLVELQALLRDASVDASGEVAVVASGPPMLERVRDLLEAEGTTFRWADSPEPREARVRLIHDSQLAAVSLAPGCLLVELDVPWSVAAARVRQAAGARRRVRLLAEGTVEETLHEFLQQAPELLERLDLGGTAYQPSGDPEAPAEDWEALLAPRDAPGPEKRTRPLTAPRPPPPPAAPPPAAPPSARQGTLFETPPGASSAPPRPETRAAPADPAAAAAALAAQLRPILGERLVDVEPLGPGLAVVVKDDPRRLRGTVRALARGLGLDPLVLDADTLDDLRPFFVTRAAGAAPAPPRARALLEEARGKLSAAEALLEAGMPYEAVGPAQRALEGAARALLLVAGRDELPGEPLLPAVYTHLVRKGWLGAEDAGCLSKARDLAEMAAQGGADLIDRPLARAVLQDARRLLEAATLRVEP